MKKKKLNILLISQNFWPENFPINAVIENLSNKVNFTILTGKPNYPGGEIFDNYKKFGVIKENFSKYHKIIRVPIYPRKKANKINLFLNYMSFLFSGIFFGFFYTRKNKFDLILVNCPSPATQIAIGLFFKKIYNLKMMTWVQDIWPESLYETGHLKKNFLYNFINYIFNFFYKQNNLLLLQSDGFLKNFQKKKINNKKIVVPNPADETLKKFFFKKNKLIKFKKKYFNIVYTGNIGTAQPFEKFCFVLNKIYKVNKNIIFHIFGEGKNKIKLIHDAKVLRCKNIKIYSYVNKSNLPGIYRQSDALLVMLKDKSIFNITIPSKFQNYLFFKKPILGWINGETKKIIDRNNCGLVSSAENVTQFQNMILKTFKLHKSGKLKSLGNNSYKLYKNRYTMKKICKLLTDSFEKCL